MQLFHLYAGQSSEATKSLSGDRSGRACLITPLVDDPAVKLNGFAATDSPVPGRPRFDRVFRPAYTQLAFLPVHPIKTVEGPFQSACQLEYITWMDA